LAVTLRRLWKNDTFRTVITIALIPILVAGFWFGLPIALNTQTFPVFTVISGSMCIPPGQCNTFADTFERTLHVGDLIIIQGVDAKDLKTDYPNSDIIVFRNPQLPKNDARANIVHRIIDAVEVNGTLYFHTKGDGNGYPNVWPQTPAQSIDSWHSTTEDVTSTYEGAISQDYVYGKVVMRIPWIGSIAMQSQKNSIIPIVLGIIIVLLIIFEFVLPLIKKKRSTPTAIEKTTNLNEIKNENI
jgi:signal peptidase I